jgi:hypothetical protein
MTLVDSMCDACSVNDAVAIIELVLCMVAHFDGIMNLEQTEAFVDGCLVGVFVEDDVGKESRPLLSWNCQVSGMMMKT